MPKYLTRRVGQLACGLAAALLWTAVAVPASAATPPTLGPEHPVAGVAIGGARGQQSGSAVASNGNGYLVAWTDWTYSRRGATGDVRAARVDAGGRLVDLSGFALAAGGDGESAPSLAWNAGVYLVVWQHDVYEPPAFPGHPERRSTDIYGARVTSDGTVLEPGGFPIAAVPGSSQYTPVVAALGGGFLVAWDDDQPDNAGIRAARVTSSGEVVDRAGIDVSTGDAGKMHPAVASTGHVALVVWTDPRGGNPDVRGKRVTAEGTLIDRFSFALASTTAEEHRPAVASNGSDFLVAWEHRSNDNPDLYLAPVSGAGAPPGPGGTPLSAGAHDELFPAIASDGATYLLSWADDRSGPMDVRSQRFRSDATPADEPSFVVGESGYARPAAAWGGDGYLVSHDRVRNSWDVYATWVPPAGPPADTEGTVVSGAANEQVDASVAWDGANYLTAWTDHRAGSDIYAGRVTPAGAPLDGSGLAVSTAANSQVQPKVAWNGAAYLIVWADYRDNHGNDTRVYGARVSVDGRVLDPEGIPISPAGVMVTPDSLAIASDGSQFLVTWRGFHAQGGGLYATRVGTDGQVLDPSGIFLGHGDRASVAWNGRRYLLSWSSGWDNGDVYAVRLARGRIIDRRPIVVSSAPGAQSDPEVASDGDGFFVAWVDRRTGGYELYGARVADSGRVLDPDGVVVARAAPDDYVSLWGLAWTGRRYLVSWARGFYVPYLTRVSRDAVSLDAEGIPAGPGRATAVAAGPADQAALLLERPVPDPPFNGATRAFVRFFQDAPGA